MSIKQSRELFVKDRKAIAITSMVRIGSKIYMGLTGGSNIIAVYDIQKDTILVKKNIFPWVKNRKYCSKIHNSMGVLEDGTILFAEGNHFTWDGLPVTVNYFRNELPEFMLDRKRRQGFSDVTYTEFCLDTLDDWHRSETDIHGAIMRYFPHEDRFEKVADLPLYLYSQSMIVDSSRYLAFGHTIPGNHFFYFDVKKRILKDFGRISDYAHHNMLVTPNGICWGGWIDKADNSLKLLKFDPIEQRLYHTGVVILNDVGRKVAGNRGIDSWIITSSGRVFMGTVIDSMIFEFHYTEERFEFIGSLSHGGRVTFMEEDDNGLIWIGADYPEMRLICFDPLKKGKSSFTDFGPISTGYARCYFHCACCYKGKLYLGETDGFSPSLHIVDLSSLVK